MNKLETILDSLIKFRDERNWKRFHTSKNLACALSVEAAELLELYQWKQDNEPVNPETLKDEIADVMIYALNLCIVNNLDPLAIIEQKIAKNERKHLVKLIS